MFHLSSTIFYFLAICHVISGLSFTHKRDVLTTTLFAYGGPTNGAPVIFADGTILFLLYPIQLTAVLGFAYIGQTIPTFASVATNITFTSDSETSTQPWTIAANSSSLSFNETLVMYITPNTGGFTAVGFASDNATLPTNATTTGFTWLGSFVAFAASESDIQMQFWANETTDAGLYALYWDGDGGELTGGFPVTLKSTPPTVLTST